MGIKYEKLMLQILDSTFRPRQVKTRALPVYRAMGDIKSQVTTWLLHGKLLLCPSYYLPRDLLQALCMYLKGLCLSFLICEKRIKWGNEMHMKSLLPWPSCFISTFILLPLPLLTLFYLFMATFCLFFPSTLERTHPFKNFCFGWLL